jgi:hypothetical protein
MSDDKQTVVRYRINGEDIPPESWFMVTTDDPRGVGQGVRHCRVYGSVPMPRMGLDMTRRAVSQTGRTT